MSESVQLELGRGLPDPRAWGDLKEILLPERSKDLSAVACHAVQLAMEIGDEVVRLRDLGLQTDYKADGTKVTNADIVASDWFDERLPEIFPARVISEETIATMTDLDRFDPSKLWWLTDPIDATNSFSVGKPDFANMCALIADGQAYVGVIGAPQHGVVYVGIRGVGSFQYNIQSGEFKKLDSYVKRQGVAKIGVYRDEVGEPELAVREALDLSGFDSVEFVKLSSALKMCKVAEGEFVASGGSRDHGMWDVAPVAPILKEAGAIVQEQDTGREPTYDPRSQRLPRTLTMARNIGRRTER